MIHKVPNHDPVIIPPVWEALESAIRIRCPWAVDLILNAASLLGIELGHADYDDAKNAAILAACRDRDWSLISHLEQEQSSRDAIVRDPRSDTLEAIEAMLGAALKAAEQKWSGEGGQGCGEPTADWHHLTNLLRTTEDLDEALDLDSNISEALYWDCDEIAVALSSHHDLTDFTHTGFIHMLELNKITAVSQVLCQDHHWKAALLDARHNCNFEELDDLIHRMQTKQENTTYTEDVLLRSSLSRQVTLRALSYHAIHSCDLSLLTWLLQIGLCTSDLSVTAVFEGEMTSLYELASHKSLIDRWDTGYWKDRSRREDECPFYLCSLLGVAALHNNALVVQFLLEEGVESGHSSALMLAVGANADVALIKMLLAASTKGRITCTRNYGASALRAAIFRKNYDALYVLLDTVAVDINGIDRLSVKGPQGRMLDLCPLSSVGEAILRRDLKAAEILIEKGADLNGLVTFDNYSNTGLNKATGTALDRASPLLAAIDTENLPMVQLLVKEGADIKHPPRLGLMRTPLQRAAEIGNFNIVQHLLNCGATVDSAPCYNGGTPLQLAALGGHTNIASLLLENGADLNHLPAKGDGRTALEAAAEWNRVDMMSLLVSWGVNFSLIVDDEGHTQYERAKGFAEKRGRMASKRFLESLWAECGVYSFNMQLFPPL
jgi:hypothetical protein